MLVKPSLGVVRFLGALLFTNLKSALALRGSFLLQVTFMALNNLTYFVFWWVLFARVPTLRGYGLREVYAMFGISAGGFGLVYAVVGGVRHLGRFIDEGELDPLLVQPKPTLLYAIGLRSQPSGWGDFLSALVFLGLSGYARPSNLHLLLLALFCSAATFLGAGIAFFSLAFWLRKTEMLSRQLWELLIAFSLYPEPLFGGALRFVLFTALPVGFISYLPVRVLRSHDPLEVLAMVAGAATVLVVGAWLFGRGLRRYSSGSRFGVFG
jgi:ABC-2 type transport system permease protein